jgi:hypothetical protein
MKRIIAAASICFFASCLHIGSSGDAQLFNSLDADDDGIVTREELEEQELVIETEKDGHKEVHQPETTHKAGPTSTMTFEQKRILLKELDQNRDGSISRPEWDRASPDGFILWNFK